MSEWHVDHLLWAGHSKYCDYKVFWVFQISNAWTVLQLLHHFAGRLLLLRLRHPTFDSDYFVFYLRPTSQWLAHSCMHRRLHELSQLWSNENILSFAFRLLKQVIAVTMSTQFLGESSGVNKTCAEMHTIFPFSGSSLSPDALLDSHILHKFSNTSEICGQPESLTKTPSALICLC